MVVLAVCFATVGCASTDWENRYRDKERQASELSGDLEAARKDLASVTATNQLLTDQLRGERSEKDRLNAELVEARNRAAEEAAAAEPAGPVVDIAGLKQRMDFGDVRQDENGNVVITLKSGITFAPGSAKLTRSGRNILGRVSGTLRAEFADRHVRVIGHTDSDPIKKSGFKDNWSLGFERARAVAVYLRDEGRIPADSLALMSRGPYEPVASNKSDTGKKQNRRVEIVVVMPRDDFVGDSR
jgi:chemotaxis protein MotB